jgi:hypothetical protein
MNQRLKWTLVVFALLCLRTAYGLSQNFWHEDVVQIYLLGLKYFTTGAWPYFGPDVVHTNQQIPGGLQSILIALALYIWPVVESPVVLVNILSLSGILLLAVYLRRRFQSHPGWLWLLWLSTLPMTLQFSTNTYNPSYLLFPAVLFFVGFFERIPQFRQLNWSALTSGIAMGFSVGFIFQLHLSWPLLMPFLLTAITIRQPSKERRECASGFVIGGLAISVSLIPTLFEYGLSTLWSTGSSNSEFNIANARNIGSTILRVVSLSSYEFMGFNLGSELDERRQLITSDPVLIISAVTMGLTLVMHVVLIVKAWGQSFVSRKFSPEISLLGVSCIWAAMLFLMTPRPPAFRNIFVLFPVAAVAFGSLAEKYSKQTWLRPMWTSVIVASVLFHSIVAIKMWPEISLYRDRPRVQKAIDENDFRIFADRRPGQY